MARRASQLRLTSRTILVAEAAPQDRQGNAPHNLPPNPQDLTWEDLLGRR